MPVPNVLEEMKLVFRREQCSANGVDRCVAPAFVVETASLVEVVEELAVGFASPKIEVANLKVTPNCDDGRCHKKVQ